MNEIEKRMEIVTMVKDLADVFEKSKSNLCEPYNISTVQLNVLFDIFINGKSKVTDICERLNKNTNTISPLINRLCTLGYLKKQKDLNDKRLTYVLLSKKSENIMENYMHDVNTYTYPMFEQLSNKEIEEVYHALSVLIRVTN